MLFFCSHSTFSILYFIIYLHFNFFFITFVKFNINNQKKQGMKKFILFLCLFTFLSNFTKSQSIPNGNFENWQTVVISNPTGAVTANLENFQRYGFGAPTLVTKVTDSHLGMYACKMETSTIGQDTSFGYAVFGSTGNSGPEGGFPYTQAPDSIVGWYKSGIMATDSALILAVFKLNGTPVYQGLYYLKGSHSSYTRFSFPLQLPGGFACDTVIVGAASSDAFNDHAPKPGSWITVDDISFVGTGITQQVPNTNFELWTNTPFEAPTEWKTYYNNNMQPSVSKTTDKYAGDYAAKITTFFIDNQLINLTLNGQQENNGPQGGHPYTLTTDTLIGYYKYFPQSVDTAIVVMQFKKNGSSFNWMSKFLFPTSTYTEFSFPFSLPMAPDSVIIFLASSTWNATQANSGSILYIDEVQFKSQPLNTSIVEQSNIFRNIVYPNPTSGYINAEFEIKTAESATISIFDISGKLILSKSIVTYVGINSHKIDLDHFTKGIYTMSIKTQTKDISVSKFIVR